VVGFQLVMAGTASAHFLMVTASASCVNNAAVISYTATSWNQTDFTGTNPEIDILFNGFKVDAQPFTLATTPKNQFSGQKPAPSGTTTVAVEGVAVDPWGDGFPSGQTSEVTVTVPTDCAPLGTGRFTGGGKQIDVGGVSITKGLTIHCDLLLSNNLEINWAGHQFHMENHLSAQCFDNPDIDQKPPKAPLDTMIGVGTGRYDGVDGFTVEFTLIDAGEPGTQDEAAFKIYETANPSNVVLNLPLTFLTGGNLQAHFDQPHSKPPNQ
jgi:hypothetical protein